MQNTLFCTWTGSAHADSEVNLLTVGLMDSSIDNTLNRRSPGFNPPMNGNGGELDSSAVNEPGTTLYLNKSTPGSRPATWQAILTGLIREPSATLKTLLKRKSMTDWILLLTSCLLMMTAFPASSILTRLYYVDGGTSKWLIAWLAPAGWPVSAVCLLVLCVTKREYPSRPTWEVTLSYAIIGLLSAADNLMFAYAYAYLPASTASLLSSSSLAFTAILAYFIVDQKFTSSSVNAVLVMSTATIILGLDSNSDRPYGSTSMQYAIGFALAVAGSALHGLIFAWSERLFIGIVGRNSFRVALELQVVTSLFALTFTTIGILITGDFGKVSDEAEGFRHGPGAYYQVFLWTAVTFQLGILGSVGCLYLASTLLAGVLNAARVPVTAVAAVICFNDPMGGFKILSIVLAVWSFASYMWGSYQQEKRQAQKRLFPSPSST